MRIQNNAATYIQNEAEKIAQKRGEHLEKEFIRKKNTIYGVTIVSLLYGTLTTILTAIQSNRFSSDFLEVAKWIWSGLSNIFKLGLFAVENTMKVRDTIPNEIIGKIVSIVLVSIVFVLITGVLYGLIIFAIVSLIKFFKKNFSDLLSGVVALTTFALLVWFSNQLYWLRFNIVCLWLVQYVVYVIVRMLIQGRKYNY